MVSSFKELIDELVTLCLATSLEDAGSIAEAGNILDKILAQDLISRSPTLAREIKEARNRIGASHRSNKPPSRKSAQQFLQLLEELSHSLYTLAAELSKLELGLPGEVRNSVVELPPEVDEQIFRDFLSNARLTLDDLEQEIEAVRQGSPDSVAAVKRRIHTLKGESGMLGLADLEHILHVTETFLERPAPSWDRADRLLLVRDWVGDAITAYAGMRHPSVLPSQIEALLLVQSAAPAAKPHVNVDVVRPLEHGAQSLPATSEIEATASIVESAPHETMAGDPSPIPMPETGLQSLPEVPSSKSLIVPTITQPDEPDTAAAVACPWAPEDQDLVIEFLHEVEEHLAAVDQILLDTEQNGIDAEKVNRLFRAFHTLKGVASFLHLQQFQELTHTTETMLDRIRSGQPIPPRVAVDLVFDSTTLLRELGAFIQQTLGTRCDLQIHAGVSVLTERLRQAIEGQATSADDFVQPAAPGEKLGEILVREGVVDTQTIIKVLETQKATGHKLGEELIRNSDVPAKAVAHALRAQQMSSEVNSKLKEVVKVDLERVDNLVEAIGELVIVESMVSNAPEIRQLPPHLRNYLGQFAKITRELQELGMCMRMVPVRAEFQKVNRIMRDLARRGNKQVRMELAGEGTEMDRIMVEQIADPLVHLIRNAVDHGIESAEERRAAGKPETGTVRLTACHESGSIIIEISDDGRGINRERVLAKAISQGIIDKNAVLSDAQIFDLLFAPGFSTAQQVTEISGRGVGMDVVKRNIESVRGRIITSSVAGKGTTFRLVLPLTLAIIDGMVIRCGDERFILPTLNIVESLQPTSEMLFSITGTNEHILVRGQTLPLVRLNRLLDVRGSENDPTKALIIIVESLRTQIALLVDEVVMKQQVVIKTLNHELDASRMFAGAAILSNGRVGLIVNVESLIDASREKLAQAADLKSKEKSAMAHSLN